MSDELQKGPREETPFPLAEAGKPSVTSRELMRGAQELLILHAGQTYRLRLTRQNKLLLTK